MWQRHGRDPLQQPLVALVFAGDFQCNYVEAPERHHPVQPCLAQHGQACSHPNQPKPSPKVGVREESKSVNASTRGSHTSSFAAAQLSTVRATHARTWSVVNCVGLFAISLEGGGPVSRLVRDGDRRSFSELLAAPLLAPSVRGPRDQEAAAQRQGPGRSARPVPRCGS